MSQSHLWTETQDNALNNFHSQGKTYKEIVHAMQPLRKGVTMKSVANRLWYLKKTKKQKLYKQAATYKPTVQAVTDYKVTFTSPSGATKTLVVNKDVAEEMMACYLNDFFIF